MLSCSLLSSLSSAVKAIVLLRAVYTAISISNRIWPLTIRTEYEKGINSIDLEGLRKEKRDLADAASSFRRSRYQPHMHVLSGVWSLRSDLPSMMLEEWAFLAPNTRRLGPGVLTVAMEVPEVDTLVGA